MIMEMIELDPNLLTFANDDYPSLDLEKDYKKYDVGCIVGDHFHLQLLFVVIDIIEDGYKIVFPRIKIIDEKIVLGQDRYFFDCDYLTDDFCERSGSHAPSSSWIDYLERNKLIEEYDRTFNTNNYFSVHKITHDIKNKLDRDAIFCWVGKNTFDNYSFQIPETAFYKHSYSGPLGG
jgi:hypothetical protein